MLNTSTVIGTWEESPDATKETDGSGQWPTGGLSATSALRGGVDLSLGLVAGSDRRRTQLATVAELTRRLVNTHPPATQPRLGRAWIHALRQELAAATRIAASRGIHGCRGISGHAESPELDLLWSLIHLLRDDGARALMHADSAARLAIDEACIRIADALRSGAFWLLGDLRSFRAVRRPFAPGNGSRRERLIRTFSRGLEAAAELQQLRLANAERLARLCEYDTISAYALREPYLLPAVIKAAIAHERGHLTEADTQVRALLPAIQSAGCIDSALLAYRVAARVATSLGNVEFALAKLREGESLAGRRSWPRLAASCVEERIRTLISLNLFDEAEVLTSRLETLLTEPSTVASPTDWRVRLWLQLHLARYRIELLRTPQSQTVAAIQQMLEHSIAQGDARLSLEISVLLVSALALLGETKLANDVFEQVLGVSADHGLFQTLIDGGPPIRALLAASVDQCDAPTHRHAYARVLLEAWPEAIPPERSSRTSARPSSLPTTRECMVLQLMSAGRSNKRIAQQLSIAPETVKSHARRIFVRLGASTRAEAVAKATRLGLI